MWPLASELSNCQCSQMDSCGEPKPCLGKWETGETGFGASAVANIGFVGSCFGVRLWSLLAVLIVKWKFKSMDKNKTGICYLSFDSTNRAKGLECTALTWKAWGRDTNSDMCFLDHRRAGWLVYSTIVWHCFLISGGRSRCLSSKYLFCFRNITFSYHFDSQACHLENAGKFLTTQS